MCVPADSLTQSLFACHYVKGISEITVNGIQRRPSKMLQSRFLVSLTRQWGCELIVRLVISGANI